MEPDVNDPMTPDESPNPMPEDDPNTDYRPQPLPDVLRGAAPTERSHPPIDDPWAERKMESEDNAPTSSDAPSEPQAEPTAEPLVAELVSETEAVLTEPAEAVPAVAVGDGGAGDDGADGMDDAALMAELEALSPEELRDRILDLRQEAARLHKQVNRLQAEQEYAQTAMGRLVSEGLSELEQRKQSLQISVEKLERRQERVRAEMRSTFAGSSQELAIRIQGFKEYLVGSLQDLVSAAEDLKLAPPPAAEPPRRATREAEPSREAPGKPQFAEQRFQDAARNIRKLLDQYRTSPDYYGSPWQLRRTFEPIHAERVSDWFFEQGGRGAIRTLGSRLQNILVASAAISVLRRMYGDRLRTLVLADSPERLGEWRRGLQDCLGIGRMDFGSNEGVTLFDAPEPLAQRADRLMKKDYLPLIIIDESEGIVDLSLLQFPLWLAFANDPTQPPMMY